MSTSNDGNIYQRTYRSDGVAELKQQVEALQARVLALGAAPTAAARKTDDLNAILAAVRLEIQALIPPQSEREQMQQTLEEVRRIMATPLPQPPSPDTSVLVTCLEQLQLLVKLHREGTEAILERLNGKRQRLMGPMTTLEPESGEAGLASREPENK